MTVSQQEYILLLDQQCGDLQIVQSVLKRLRCSVFVANSIEQAVARAGQIAPYLVILAGNHQDSAQSLVHKLRWTIQSSGHKSGVTIVALTESHNPSWIYEEDYSGIDGFLVKPLSGDILTTLVQSAWAKQSCA